MTTCTVPARPAKAPFVIVLTLTASMLAVRLAETHGDPVVFLRIAGSLAGLAIVFAGRRNLLRSALLAFALEATGGILSFIYVDAPFVNAHHTQIAALAVAIRDRIEASPSARR